MFIYRFTEFADHLHEHFVDPVVVKNGYYQLPKVSTMGHVHEVLRLYVHIPRWMW